MATAKKQKPLKLEGTTPKTVDPVVPKDANEITGVSPEYGKSVYNELGKETEEPEGTTDSTDENTSKTQTPPAAPKTGDNK